MKMKQRSRIHALYGTIEVKQGNLLQRPCRIRPSAPPPDTDKPGLFQLLQQPSDHNRIGVYTRCEKLARHFMVILKRLNTYEHMNRNRESA